MVARLLTKMLISITDASRAMTAKTVGMASAAISSGSPAATSVPNTASRMSSAIGRLIVSAMTRSCSIFWLNSW